MKTRDRQDHVEAFLSRFEKKVNNCNLIIENVARNESTEAILDETLLKHFIIRPMQEMTKFRGSKYIGHPAEIRIKLGVPEFICQDDDTDDGSNETAASDATNAWRGSAAAGWPSAATARSATFPTDAAGYQKSGTAESRLYDFIEPRYALDDIYLPQSVREQITEALLLVKNHDTLFNVWGLENTVKKGTGLVFNFYGPPGTGKSITAEAIAKEIGRAVMLVNYPNLESKYVGETPKNIQKVFADAKQRDAVLVFDEADSFLGKRLTSVTQAADYGVNVTRSTMFMEIEKYNGIVIFTTNLVRNYDAAFMRRILASVEFTMPDQNGRQVIWELLLPPAMPLGDSVNPAVLAERYEDLSGADIKDAILLAALACIRCEAKCVDLTHFDQAIKRIRNRRLPEPKIMIKEEDL